MARKKSTSAQMEMFQDGGLKDQGEMVDPVTNNPVPIGSTKKEVRDNIPANLSEGEFVLPADVVRYHGLEKIMGFRDQAKDGLQKMEQMGQMGNSDEATVPDGVPFKQMAVGGNVGGTPTIQQPTIVQPTIQPNPVQGTQTVAPVNPALRQSIYAQPQQPIQQPIQRPIVGIPGMPVYGQQGPQYKQPTDTAKTPPNYSDVIGAPFGQLQKSETRKYVNEEGLELYIPFVNGEPLYPIPNGYKYTEVIGKEKEKEEVTGAVKTTQTRTPDSSGDDGGSQDPDTQEYKVASQLMASDAQAKSGFLTALDSKLKKAFSISPVGMFIDKFSGAERRLSQGPVSDRFGDDYITDENQKDITSRDMGYTSYNDIVNQIGVIPSFKLGSMPGDVSRQTGKIYNFAGQSTGTDGSVAYSSYEDFTNAMAATASTGWAGGYMTDKDIADTKKSQEAKYGKGTWDGTKAKEFQLYMDNKYGNKITSDDIKTNREERERIAEEKRQETIAIAKREEQYAIQRQKAEDKKQQEQQEKNRQEREETNARREQEDRDRFGTVTTDNPGDGGDSGMDESSGGGDGGYGGGNADGSDGGWTAVGGFINKRTMTTSKTPPNKKKMKRGGLASRK